MVRTYLLKFKGINLSWKKTWLFELYFSFINLINTCNKICDDKKIYYLQTEKLVFPEFIQNINFFF